MKKLVLTPTLVLLFTLLPQSSWSQLQSATIGGTVTDATEALIPGVEVTATNTGTAIAVTTLTNNTGTYSFTLQPGNYTLSATLPGFQTRTFTDVTLGTTQRLRLNFALDVADVAQEVEVVATADTLLVETSQSVGDVLPELMVQNLPSVGNDIVTMLQTVSGVRLGDNGVTGTINGLSTNFVNVQRDGIDARQGAKWSTGVKPATYTNPDMIAEVRVITAPVDAELGRGNGTFIMTTRSGTNQYRGSAVWSLRNSALDANSWDFNNDIDALTGDWSPTTPDWINRNQYSVSLGGPIVRNKTFFFVLWDQSIVKNRRSINTQVMTPCARNGVFRFFDAWNNGNLLQSTSRTAGSSRNRTQVVDATGQPALFVNGVRDANAEVRYASVFGQLVAPPQAADCSDAQVVPGTAWDQHRTQMDPTGFVRTFFDAQPLPNNYEVGDGLNIAGHRWVRRTDGGQSIFARNMADAVPHEQINFKIDHNFNNANRLAVTYSYETTETSRGGAEEEWPDTYAGRQFSYPQHLAINFTSTLSPTMLNEVKVGFRKSGLDSYNAFNNPDTGAQAQAFYPNIGGFPTYIGLGDGAMNFQSQGWIDGTTSSYLDKTGLWSFGDTMSWTRGEHSFKFGGEVRRGYSNGKDAGITPNAYPQARGGTTSFGLPPSITSADVAGLNGTSTFGNRDAMQHMLNALSGSLSEIRQYYWMQEPDKLDAFENLLTAGHRHRIFHINEFNGFFKDDWKVTSDLTLNLGIRYDWIGVLYDQGGMMPAPVGRNENVWGMNWDGQGSPFDTWMVPGDRGEDMQVTFVGKHSPDPGRPWRPDDRNNFAPAVGFAWQIPWFGAGQTTLRAGYQISYLQSEDSYNAVFQETNWPGMTYQARHRGDSVEPYLDLTDLNRLVPVPVLISPLQSVPRTSRLSNLYIPDPEQTSPYIQNITATVTRSLGRNVTVEAGYVATLYRKGRSFGINLNEPNFLYNGLKEALDEVRVGNDMGPNALLLERLFQGVNVAGRGFGPVGTTLDGVQQTAGLHLRSDSRFRTDLANGDFAEIANTIGELNYLTQYNPTLPPIPSGVTGAVLGHADTLYPGQFPANFVVANPQLNNIQYVTNDVSSNYHSGYLRFTLRPTAGLSSQTTYTWSKSMGYPGGSDWTNPLDRNPNDYQILGSTRVHELRTHGVFTLPMGPNQPLFGDSSGALARIVEGWQMSWIANVNTGAPLTISTFAPAGFFGGTGVNHLYDSGVPDAVGSPEAIKELFRTGGKVAFGTSPDLASTDGTYFGTPGADFQMVSDPQCNAIHSSLSGACTMTAIADASGQILLQNPHPGNRGTFGQTQLFGPGRWRFDASLSKLIQLDESKALQFRVDAQNVFNHPEPNAPIVNVNDGDFGLIEGKNDQHRLFQLEVRLNF